MVAAWTSREEREAARGGGLWRWPIHRKGMASQAGREMASQAGREVARSKGGSTFCIGDLI